MYMIMDCTKEQRKGFDVDSTVDETDENSSNYQPSRVNVEWESQIESLNLSHHQISVISNLELFTNLRKLILMDNSIAKIQCLESCSLLEELSLEKNKIKIIENLSHMKYLKKLDLG